MQPPGKSSQDLLLFLDEHLEVTDPRWLSQLVGVVGLGRGGGASEAACSRPDGRLVTAGYQLGFNGGSSGGHSRTCLPVKTAYLNLRESDCAIAKRFPADCLLIPAPDPSDGRFDRGGFPTSMHDADYGLRLGEHGYRSVLCGERPN